MIPFLAAIGTGLAIASDSKETTNANYGEETMEEILGSGPNVTWTQANSSSYRVIIRFQDQFSEADSPDFTSAAARATRGMMKKIGIGPDDIDGIYRFAGMVLRSLEKSIPADKPWMKNKLPLNLSRFVDLVELFLYP